MCSIPPLVDWSPSILAFLTSIPGVKQITEAIVRNTFFAQFVGADTALECVPLLERLRGENKGALFAYSVEVDEHEASGHSRKATVPVYKRIVAEMIHSIDVAADFEDRFSTSGGMGRRTWVAVKLTALLPNAQALINFSDYLTKTRPPLKTAIAFPGCPRSTDLDIIASEKTPADSRLTEQDIIDLKDLHADLVKICERAQERGVRIIIDAEHTWYQPAIDAFSLALMRQFNQLPKGKRSSESPLVLPLIYGTFQAYLRRTPEYILQSLQDARDGNYALGVKLVRGAYHPLEVSSHLALTSAAPKPSLSISPDPEPPVWSTKPDTDKCYNTCARILIDTVQADLGAAAPHIGLLFGSHNWDSCNLILDLLVERGMAVRDREDGREVVRVGDAVTERLTLAQLYGMSDELTEYLVQKTRSSSPLIIKYIPYGALSEVMPYLGRRAIENKSVLGDGQAAAERRHAWDEIRRRLWG
ncbi:FAD-linked oxidoreductase [Dentipellis sp. KUC8613]|nr:FAD-linked oxidoreductase [Dentipellis sp. KUC8613]